MIINRKKIFTISLTNIKLLCWYIINIFLIWSVLFSKLNIISNLCLLGLCFLSWNILHAKEKKLSYFLIFFVLVLTAYSIIACNSIPKIIRFALIIFFVGFSYFIKLPLDKILKGFKWIALPYCLFLIICEVIIIGFLDEGYMSYIRNEVVIGNGLGDVYPKYGNFYAIQLRGTALLPFIFMLSFIVPLFKRKDVLCKIILLAGIIIAGNFAYLLGIGIFFIFLFINNKLNIKQWFNRFIVFLFCAVSLGPFIFTFINNQIEQKKEISNATRIDQAEVLISNMSSSPITALFGMGLGNNINIKTNYRDYSDNDYFELQSLYFLNQMGVLPFFIFLLYNIYCSLKYIKYRKGILLYISYIFYALANPYILDTTQIIVIITLVSLRIISKNTDSIRITNLKSI